MSTSYYSDEHVTLYHGDCLTENREWLNADVLVTDPPYGVRMTMRHGDARIRLNRVPRTANAIAGDKTTEARDMVEQAWGDRPAVMFGSWRVVRPSRLRAVLIWHKEGAFSGPCNAAFFTNHEEIYILGEGAWRKSAPPLRSVLTSSEHRSHAAADVGHPTPKPLGIMEALIDRCPPGTVADPFAGSGSTLVAAKMLGRTAIGVELEERYCEIIAKRLAQGALDFGGVA